MTFGRGVRILLRGTRWGLIAFLVVLAGYVLILRPWHLRWGATPGEVAAGRT